MLRCRVRAEIARTFGHLLLKCGMDEMVRHPLLSTDLEVLDVSQKSAALALEECLSYAAIQRVIFDFFRHLDEREYEQLCALMAPDGVWMRSGERLTGPSDVMRAMKLRPVGFTTRHLITNIVVDITGAETAVATYYLTVFVHESAKAATGPVPISLPRHVSVFLQKFIRVDGAWKVAELSSSVAFHG